MSQLPSPTDPAMAPPGGVPAEFHNPYSLAPYQRLTIILSVITTTIMVSARMYTKKVIVKAVKWEDCELHAEASYMLRRIRRWLTLPNRYMPIRMGKLKAVNIKHELIDMYARRHLWFG